MSHTSDLNELCGLGSLLDKHLAAFHSRTPGVFLAKALLKVRAKSGAIVPLVPNRVQSEFERRRGQSNIVLKARQMGVSTWVAGRFFLKTITQPGTLSVQVAHTQNDAELLFAVVRRFYDRLPQELRRGVLRTSKANSYQLVFPTLDSEYRVVSAGDTNAGRGMTIQNLHCSEVSRWPGNSAETLAGLRAAMPPGGELVLESTPNGPSGCFYNEWRNAEETGLVRHFFPWWWESAYVSDAVTEDSLTADESHLRARWGLRLEQIAHRRKLKLQCGALTRQEYAEDAEECFLTSGDCFFEVEAIDRRLRETTEPMECRLAGALQIWFPPASGREYIVAADPAGGGVEGDYSAVQVVDRETGLQCAELRAKLTVLEFARECAALAAEYNGALLVIERNNHGSGVLAYLKTSCRYDRLYSKDGKDGWLTTSVSRPAVLATLGSAIADGAEILQSRRLLTECRMFVRHANGTTSAQAGEHDDCVMAMAIGLAVRAEFRGSNARWVAEVTRAHARCR